MILLLLVALQDAERILEKYREVRPAEADLDVYTIDWAPGLKEARERAAKERRPVLLVVVTNSYGNLYSGHC